APFGPMMALRSPGLTESETSCTARKPPNDFESLLSSSSGTRASLLVSWLTGRTPDPIMPPLQGASELNKPRNVVPMLPVRNAMHVAGGPSGARENRMDDETAEPVTRGWRAPSLLVLACFIVGFCAPSGSFIPQASAAEQVRIGV